MLPINRKRSFILAPVILAIAFMAPSVSYAEAACTFNPNYEGPATIQAIDLSRTSAAAFNSKNQLPSELSRVLETAFSESLKLTAASAASISFYSSRHGYWNFEVGTPVKSGNVFWLGSISKLVTAAVIFQQIEEKQLLLSDTIERWFPDLPGANLITINQLLMHTSGLIDFTAIEGVNLDQERITPQNILSSVKQSGVAFCPGSNWSYTNTGYLLLSEIASQLDNLPWSEVVFRRISKQLKLASLKVPTNSGAIDSIVMPASGSEETFKIEILNSQGAASLVSNTHDAVKLLSHYLRGDIFSSSTLADIGNPLYPLFTQIMGYGKGIMVTRVPDPSSPTTWIGHAGGSSKGKALLIYDTKRQTYVAITLNAQAQAEAIANTMLKIYDQYVLTRTPKETPKKSN